MDADKDRKNTFGFEKKAHRWGEVSFSTFIAGVFIVSYQVYVAYASGRTAGQYVAPSVVHKRGRAGLALLLLWIAAIVISIKNYL